MSLIELLGGVTKKQHQDAMKAVDERLAVMAEIIGELEARVAALEAGQPTPEPPPPDPDPEPGPDPDPDPDPPPPDPEPENGLRVRPYTPRNADEQRAFERAVAYLEHVAARTDNSGSGGIRGVLGYAEQADLYQLARPARDTETALIQALAAVGDTRFMNTVDSIMETARGSLKRGWRGVSSDTGQQSPNDPVAPGGNGYIEPGQHPAGIFVWGPGSGPNAVHTGRDVHLLDSPKTAALIAQACLAYHENRHVAGYAAKRDFWLSWLTAWEEAWRSNRWRRGRPKLGPIFNRSDGHVAHAEMLFYVHMHLLTGEARFLDYADLMQARFWASSTPFRLTPTPAGEALVWPRGSDQSERFLTPITYGRYYLADALELHRLGFGEYASVETMRRFARTITELVLLPGLPSSSGGMATARDVGGGVDRAGYPASPAASWNGLTVSIVTSWTSFALYEQFDSTGRLHAWNNAANSVMAWGESPRGYGLPLGRLIAEARR